MLFREAQAFIENMYKECHYETQIINKRLHDIELEIKETGTYTHTEEELIYGAKMAWRNSNRCIGRLFWDSLNVIDAKMLLTKHRSYHQLLIILHRLQMKVN